MKILIVSLLRLGDVLLALPLLESIRKENPEAEIHFLVNRSSEGLEPIVPYVKSWHYFNRIELQKGLGEYQTPIFDSYHQLAELVDKLNSEKFDRLINLTQNRLSGWLCAAIDAEDKLGFVLSRSGGIRYGSSWFRYLNDYGAGGAKDIFHYSDIFSYGAGYVPSQKVELNETQQGWKEAADILGTDSYEGPLVILQALTSDNKKDWGLNHWAEMAICLKGLLPKSRVIALGANFEQEKIETLIEKCLEKKIKIEKAICSLPTALSLLNRSHLLITGDTSIKHLAGFTNCSVIELSMGSSDYRKTGIYRGGNLILQALESCAPCSHTQSCFHKDPICRDKISPILVALVAKSLLADNKEELLALTRKWREKVDILKTHFTSSGYWMATNLDLKSPSSFLSRHIEKSSWKMLFSGQSRNQVGEFGSEARNLLRSLADFENFQIFGNEKLVFSELEKVASDHEKWSRKLASLSCGLNAHFQCSFESLWNENGRQKEFWDCLSSSKEEDDSKDLLVSFLKSGQNRNDEQKELIDLTRVRRFRNLVDELRNRSEIRLKLIRSIQSEQREIV